MQQTIRISFLFLLSFLLASFPGFPVWEPVFPAGEYYIFYLNSPSSQAQIYFSEDPYADKLRLTEICGESTVYAGDRTEELLERYDAKICFSEEVAGVVSYYCHSPKCGGGVLLSGHAVNLQIARSKTQTAVGTPLIFGGF